MHARDSSICCYETDKRDVEV
jgi:hypothetical protein